MRMLEAMQQGQPSDDPPGRSLSAIATRVSGFMRAMLSELLSLVLLLKTVVLSLNLAKFPVTSCVFLLSALCFGSPLLHSKCSTAGGFSSARTG